MRLGLALLYNTILLFGGFAAAAAPRHSKVAAIGLFLQSAANGDAAPAARQEIQTHQYLVGNWNCTFTVGSIAGKYTTTWSNVLGNRWLKQLYDQPASGNTPGFRAEYLIGYNQARRFWVRFGAMTDGQYFAIRMTDTPNGGWAWKYVRFLPTGKPEPPGTDATFTKKSNTEYTVDGPTYSRSGTMVTEHHICMKAR